MSKLNDFRKETISKTEAVMLDFIRESTSDEQLKESMLYSLAAGGKRIRPLLLVTTLNAFQTKDVSGAYQAAAALEMIHTYSLIHDDLPAMDDDDLRRGKPTNHKVFGEATAILAGDGLLTAAFESLSIAEIDPEKKISLLQLLTKAAGTQGMVAGQSADMQAEGKKIPLDELVSIHQRKTGALIRFAVVAGGILADQPQEILASLDQLAKHLGLAFQIRDDLLDVVGTTEELGKEAHRDQLLEKSTYPGLLGLEGAKEALTSELQAADDLLTELSDKMKDPSLLGEVLSLFRL
ncbi:polyprenyl synthetase family protein [Enterococcus olivae]